MTASPTNGVAKAFHSHSSAAPSIRAYMYSCPSRRETCEATLTRWRATDWGEDPLVLWDEGTGGSIPERIAANAHRMLSRAAADGMDYALFLEDDLLFNFQLRHNMEQWLPLRRGWLWMGSLYNPGITPAPGADLASSWRNRFLALTPAHYFGTQAVVLSRQALLHILRKWNPAPHWDSFLARIAADESRQVFAHVPSIVQHLPVSSTWGGGYHRAVDFDPFFEAASVVKTPPRPKPKAEEPRVLFTSHELSMTGAPIVLANVIPALRGIKPILHAPCDGPLLPRLESSGVDVRLGDIDLSGADVVVVNTVAAEHVVRKAKAKGVPCIWMIHESDPNFCGNEKEVREILDYPRRLIFPAESTARAFGLQPDHRVRIIPPVVPPCPKRNRLQCRESLGLAPDDFMILCCGTVESRKGQRDLMQAIRGMPARVFLIGRLHDPSQIDDMPDNVTVVGLTGDPWSYYAAADLLVSCSRMEAFPLNIQEGKQYGLPVIVTPVFGTADQIIDGVHGYHYQPGDVPALREKIQLLLRDEAGRKALGASALTHLPTWTEYLRLIEGCILDVAGRQTCRDAIQVVYHCAGMGAEEHWHAIVSEQFEQFADAGLTDVLCTHVGAGLDWVLDEANRWELRLVVAEHHDNVEVWEEPAIRLIERLVRSSDLPILYCHSKGVSRPLSEYWNHTWRRLMMRDLVCQWRTYLEDLGQFDAVGVNWWTDRPHFSGNFWLARADWLRRLPAFDGWKRDRWSPERWIGAVEGCRAKWIHCANKKFWVDDGGQDDVALLEKLWEG